MIHQLLKLSYIYHAVPRQCSTILIKPVCLKNSTDSSINESEKRSHFHVADEQVGISTKEADDRRGLQYWPSYQNDVVTKPARSI
jgi:hypothetical protein